ERALAWSAGGDPDRQLPGVWCAVAPVRPRDGRGIFSGLRLTRRTDRALCDRYRLGRRGVRDGPSVDTPREPQLALLAPRRERPAIHFRHAHQLLRLLRAFPGRPPLEVARDLDTPGWLADRSVGGGPLGIGLVDPLRPGDPL